MKLTLLALMLPLFCFSQNEKTIATAPLAFEDSIPATSFYLANRNIVFQKVITSNLRKDELIEKINTLLLSNRDFRMDQGSYTTSNGFFGKIVQHRVDQDFLGTVPLTALSALSLPLSAGVVVQVKDYKYRVTVSEVVFREFRDTRDLGTEWLLEELFTQKKRTELKPGKSYLKVASILDKEFTEMFDLNKSVITAEF